MELLLQVVRNYALFLSFPKFAPKLENVCSNRALGGKLVQGNSQEDK